MTKSLQKSAQDRRRADEFLQCYNTIDSELRRRLGQTRKTKFTDLVAEFEKAGWDHDEAECLRRAATIRNFVVHEPKKPHDFCAIPTAQMLEELTDIQDRLINPEKVVPRFAKKVEVVSTTDTLVSVLKTIYEKVFSQLPVYSGKKFKGVLTENGLTRWLAKYVITKLPLVDLGEVFVEELLREEEQRRNYKFISRELPTQSARAMFRDDPLLETLLITKSGNRRESLEGIITRWDIVHSPRL